MTISSPSAPCELSAELCEHCGALLDAEHVCIGSLQARLEAAEKWNERQAWNIGGIDAIALGWVKPADPIDKEAMLPAMQSVINLAQRALATEAENAKLQTAARQIQQLGAIQLPENDEYRRGQMRGYQDCARMIDAALAAIAKGAPKPAPEQEKP